MIDKLLHKIKRKLIKLRLQPIRVYCMHHVCAEFDAESMNRGDWMQIDEFKAKVSALRKAGVEFISLKNAYRYISKDIVRCKKYAVLAFDDGYASLKEILPWMEDQQIPATLFINGKYLDGKSYRKNPKEKYLTKKELWTLTSPLIEIGHHGWEHNHVPDMTNKEFEESMVRNMNLLHPHPNYVPFWAYTYGEHTDASDEYLKEQHIVPIYIDGLQNYNDAKVIHRELLQ